MSDSYRKIDYRVRPAKSIERKMLLESFRRLADFGALDSYRYVGFGSLYFADFALFHRSLGIVDMTSIENTQDPTKQLRFQLNVPYGNIEMRFGHSNVELAKMNWEQRSIVWLDYDGTLDESVLIDTEFLTRKVTQGSMLIVSINASAPALNSSSSELSEGEPSSLLDRLKERVGSSLVPHDLKASDLSGWGVAEAYRRILNTQIEKALVVRNAALSPAAHLRYRQLFNFNYSDGAKMLTMGGIFYDVGQKAMLAKCAFDQLSFVRFSESAYRIETPFLTYKEIREIDARRGKSTATTLPVPQIDIDRYSDTYRYFPHFAEAEMG